jgi:hypothetical protein
MARMLDFTGGVRCENCDEQIPVERVRTVPRVTRCVLCQAEHNRQLGLMFKTLLADDDAVSSAVLASPRDSVRP